MRARVSHVTGEALYTDDLLLRFPRVLHAWPVLSPHAHAVLKRLDSSRGVFGAGRLPPFLRRAMFRARAIRDRTGMMSRCFRPRFCSISQPVAWVLGDTLDAAQRGRAARGRGIRSPAGHPKHRGSH